MTTVSDLTWHNMKIHWLCVGNELVWYMLNKNMCWLQLLCGRQSSIALMQTHTNCATCQMRLQNPRAPMSRRKHNGAKLWSKKASSSVNPTSRTYRSWIASRTSKCDVAAWKIAPIVPSNKQSTCVFNCKTIPDTESKDECATKP